MATCYEMTCSEKAKDNTTLSPTQPYRWLCGESRDMRTAVHPCIRLGSVDLLQLHCLVGLAGGRYDGLLKAAWQQAAVTSSPPPAAVGLTLNAERLTLLASTPKAKTPSVIPYLSQVAAAVPPPFSPPCLTAPSPSACEFHPMCQSKMRTCHVSLCSFLHNC